MQPVSVVYLRCQHERSALHCECFGKLHLCLWVVAACGGIVYARCQFLLEDLTRLDVVTPDAVTSLSFLVWPGS